MEKPGDPPLNARGGGLRGKEPEEGRLQRSDRTGRATRKLIETRRNRPVGDKKLNSVR